MNVISPQPSLGAPAFGYCVLELDRSQPPDTVISLLASQYLLQSCDVSPICDVSVLGHALRWAHLLRDMHRSLVCAHTDPGLPPQTFAPTSLDLEIVSDSRIVRHCPPDQVEAVEPEVPCR